ncbi:MAG: prohibitin family protein [Nanoarchaeota archaeon]
MSEENKIITKWIVKGVLGLIGLIIGFGAFAIISAGERGVILRFGAVNRVLDSGIHWKIPIIEGVRTMDIRTQKEEIEAQAASKDLQNVSAVIALNYNLMSDKVGLLYQEIGLNYKERIIDPAIQEAVKAATAQYTAEELVTKRPLVRDNIKMELTQRLTREYIQVTELSIVNFDFSQSFNSAIEAKVTAEQNALAAKNKLEQVKFEKEQRIAQAQGEAEAIRIQAQAITQQGGENYVQLKAVEKWNGVLPAMFVPGSSIPFLNMVK